MTKVVITEDDCKRCSVARHTAPEHRKMANMVMEEALALANLAIEDISFIVATGYGRMNVPFADRQTTELTCHARGLASIFPKARLGIDVGGQDAKALVIKDGKLIDFVMNDKCAAGTGRFLEVIAKVLGLKVEEFDMVASASTQRVNISSPCTVFAEHEIITLLSHGVPLADIAAALFNSIGGRVARMARKLKIEQDVIFTGGVARSVGVRRSLEEHLSLKIQVPDDPLLTGALGAALIGCDIVRQGRGGSSAPGGRRLSEAKFYT